MSEVHMAVADPVEMPGYSLVWAPRRCVLGGAGGVAVAVRRDSTVVSEVVVEEGCGRADVMWVRVTLGQVTRPLFLAAVYLPPAGVEHCCSGCGNPSCAKSHTGEAVAAMETAIKQYAARGDVFLTGDFNVRAGQHPPSPRWKEVDGRLLGGECVLLNPTGADGGMQATRRDPATGRESVLDLVLAAAANKSATTCAVDPTTCISDHYPILLTVCLPTDAASGVQLPTDYGVRSTVPTHWRSKPAVTVGRASSQLDQYRELVDGTVKGMDPVTSELEEELAKLEGVILRTAYATGLCSQKRDKDSTVAVFTTLQRQLEKARRRLRVVQTAAETNVALEGRVAEAAAAVKALEDSKAQQFPARRQAMRVRKRQAVQQRNAEVQQWWIDGEAGLLAQRMAKEQAGLGKAKGRRVFVRRRLQQEALYAKELYLREKYCSAPPTDWDTVLAGVVVNEDDVHLPTLQEIASAVHQLNGSSAAIGMPAFVLKWASTPTVMQRVHRIIQEVWRTGSVPASFCLVEAVALPKPQPAGAPPAFRIIGVGGVVAKVFRLVMNARVMKVVAPRLSPLQFGFVNGKSTEQAAFLSTSAAACAQATGTAVDSVYLDIAGAYGSTQWAVVMRRLQEMGVSPDILRLNADFLRQQSMFVKVGSLCSGLMEVRVGLTEGDPMSPLQFIITVDGSINRLQSAVLESGVPVGLPMLDGTQLTCVWFADDGRLLATSQAGMQLLLDVCDEGIGGMGYRFNLAPTKTAAQRLPAASGPRGAATPSYTLQGKAVPWVQSYKHVGIWTHSAGPAAAAKAQIGKLAPIVATVVRQAVTAPLRQRPLLYVTRLYTTFWLPQVTYAVGLWATTAPQLVEDMESVVLRATMAAANTPLVVLRSVLGLPCLQTRLDMDRIRVLLSFLTTSARSHVRQQLCTELRVYDECVAAGRHAVARGLWWARTLQVLEHMDSTMTQQFQQRHPLCPPSWLAWVRERAQQWDAPAVNYSDVSHLCRLVLLEVEGGRRRWELQRCHASLGEVADLLDSPNMAPFVVDPNREASLLRVQLRGGRRVLFGWRHFHLYRCPWCTEAGCFTVPHLLRDCRVWDEARIRVWERARAVAVREGVKVAAGVETHRHLWYRFMCGAAVPHSFLGLHLDRETHFARGEVSASKHLRTGLRVYLSMLGEVGEFLREVVDRTRERLATPDPAWEYTPEANARRIPIRHAEREAAAAAAPAAEEVADREAETALLETLQRALEAMEQGNEAEGRRIIQDALGEDGDLDLDAILEEFGRTG